jgi:hypothetical protein
MPIDEKQLYHLKNVAKELDYVNKNGKGPIENAYLTIIVGRAERVIEHLEKELVVHSN